MPAVTTPEQDADADLVLLVFALAHHSGRINDATLASGDRIAARLTALAAENERLEMIASAARATLTTWDQGRLKTLDHVRGSLEMLRAALQEY